MVWFATLWQKAPVFHDWSIEPYTGKTYCGLKMWDREAKHGLGTLMPDNHARKFARPCRRCWA